MNTKKLTYLLLSSIFLFACGKNDDKLAKDLTQQELLKEFPSPQSDLRNKTITTASTDDDLLNPKLRDIGDNLDVRISIEMDQVTAVDAKELLHLGFQKARESCALHKTAVVRQIKKELVCKKKGGICPK